MNRRTLIFDNYGSLHGLHRDLSEYLKGIYHTELIEGFTLSELTYWWVVVNIESMYCLALHDSCVFLGSPQLRYALENFSAHRSSRLYRELLIPPIDEPNIVIDVVGFSVII